MFVNLDENIHIFLPKHFVGSVKSITFALAFAQKRGAGVVL